MLFRSKYTDIYGKPQFIYSWKLVPTDKTPAGKRDDISLREKETQIKKDLNDGIDTAGGKMTVCQLYDKKNSQRKNIKRATEKGRLYLMNALKNDPLGMRAIDTVKQSDAKEWAIRMSIHKILSSDRKSTRLNSSHDRQSRMPSSA